MTWQELVDEIPESYADCDVFVKLAEDGYCEKIRAVAVRFDDLKNGAVVFLGYELAVEEE